MTVPLSQERLEEIRALAQRFADPRVPNYHMLAGRVLELLAELERLQEVEDAAGALAACEYCESALNGDLDETNRHLAALGYALNRGRNG